jgi:phage host-nuclease inhibitor protein Gam
MNEIMGKRTKKTVLAGVTSAQADQAFAEFAKADARIAKINADMDVQFTKIREKYADELADLADEKENAFDVMQVYAMENKDTLFAKKKSLDTVHGTFGFRMGTPKLKTLKGFTWPAVTQLLKEFLPKFVRISEEPAKDLLLASREDEAVCKLYAKCGFEVIQEETFYVERKTEEVEA